MVVDPKTTTRKFLAENPQVAKACKAFGQSARQIVSEARQTGESIERMLTGYGSQRKAAVALVAR